MRKRFIVLIVVSSLVAAACSSDSGGSADGQIDDLDPGEISRSTPGRLAVEVGGDIDFTYEETLDLQIVAIRHPEVTAVRFLSVGILEGEGLPDGSGFRVAFDLAGVFDGAGDYELPAVGETSGPPISVDPDDPSAGAVSGISKPFLTYSPAGPSPQKPEDLAQVRSFENALEPCSLEVQDDDGGAGILECPAITDTEGKGRISLRMEWEEE